MDIEEQNQNIIYNLCMPIQHHKDTLRTVACNSQGLVVTGSFDKTCAFYQCNEKGDYHEGSYLQVTNYSIAILVIIASTNYVNYHDVRDRPFTLVIQII